MKSKKANTNLSEAGFSLIELMIAIAILGIASAIAIPSLMDSIIGARNQKAAEEVNNTLTAINVCTTQYGCEFITQTTVENEMFIKCQTCSDPAGEGKVPFISSSDLTIAVNQSPMWGDFLISAYHNKGDKTYCLHNSPVYDEIYADTKDLSLCDTAVSPF